MTDSGLLQWTYEKDLRKNRYHLYLLLKIFGFVLGGCFVILLVLLSGNSEFMEESFSGFLACGIGAIILSLGLIILIYTLVARSGKGREILSFEMDETGIRRVMTDQQIRRDAALGKINSTLSWLGTGPNALNAGRIGTQLETGAYRTCKYSRIVAVKCLPKYDRIHIRDADKVMEVFASGSDYEMVKQFLTERLPEGVRIKG